MSYICLKIYTLITLRRLINQKNLEKVDIFNIVTGKGTWVLQVITAFKKVSGQKLNYKIVSRREGDVVLAFASTTKANNILGWKATSTLEEGLLSAWNWEQKIAKKNSLDILN